MEQPTEELLGVQVSPGRLASARAIHSTTKWIVGIGLVYSLVLIGGDLVHLSYSHPEKYTRYPSYYLLLSVNPWITLVHCGIFITELFLFFHYITYIKNGLENSDSEIFDRSFTALQRYLRIVLIGLALGLLSGGLDLWVQIDWAHLAAAARNK